MKQFDKGVSYYTKAVVEIGFPEDDICCMRCPLIGKVSGTSAEICRMTGEILPAPFGNIGFNCPLKFKEIDNEKNV
jgi:hypothetical protein